MPAVRAMTRPCRSGMASCSSAFFLELRAVLALDAPADAAAAWVVRHQHHVAAGQADERGQGARPCCRAFLVDLDQPSWPSRITFRMRACGRDAALEIVAEIS